MPSIATKILTLSDLQAGQQLSQADIAVLLAVAQPKVSGAVSNLIERGKLARGNNNGKRQLYYIPHSSPIQRLLASKWNKHFKIEPAA